MPITEYAQKTDLERYGVGRAVIADALNDPIVEAALEAAEGIANKKLAQQFYLPLSAISAELTMYVCWIAAYVVMSSIGYAPEPGQNDVYRQRYLDALKWFDEVAKGEEPVGVVGGPGPGAAPGAPGALVRAVVVSGSSRGFSSRGDGSGVVHDLVTGRGGFVGD